MKKIIAAVLMVFLVPAYASAAVFYFTSNNAGLTGGPWASITLTDTAVNGLDAVHFVVDPIDSAFGIVPDGNASNFGLQTFYFNENTGFLSAANVVNFDPSGWNVTFSSPPAQNAGGGFGKFVFEASGSGSTRANPLMFDVFAPAGQEITIANLSTVLSTEGYLFAGHIAGFPMNNGVTSAKFATPEPSTLILLGGGLLGLVWVGRRRLKK
jgi:hypothetical protein